MCVCVCEWLNWTDKNCPILPSHSTCIQHIMAPFKILVLVYWNSSKIF